MSLADLRSPRRGLAGAQLRRSIDALTPGELDGFRKVFAQLLSARGPGNYYELAGIPGLPKMASHHGDDLFLPWNRACLRYFECALMRHDVQVALPWWDWTSFARDLHLPAAFETETVDGEPNALHSVPIPEEIQKQTSDSRTFREPNPAQAPTSADVEAVLALGDFEDFAAELEVLHNRTHVSVGGTLGFIALGSFDPLFWSLQANVDRLWRIWQIHNPTAELSPEFLAMKLEPFDVKVSDVVRVGELEYDYDLTGETSFLVAGTAGASSDRPSSDGGFGFESYADAFATLIASPLTKPPLTIGVYGSWGVGKSSLLGQIVERLEGPEIVHSSGSAGLRHLFGLRRRSSPTVAPGTGENAPRRVHVVCFNAWDYSASELVWPALVRKTMDHLEERVPLRWTEKVRHRLARNVGREWRRNQNRIIATAVVTLLLAGLAVARLKFSISQVSAALVALGVAGVLGLAGQAAANPLSRWLATLLKETSYGQQTDLMSEIREDLGFLDERLGEDTRILIVIDDLDRCEPARAVEVLQAVNLLLNFPSFIVCLGIDARIVTAAIETYYKGLLGEAGASGYEYLDKIIQIPFRIPEPTPADLEEFLGREVSVRVSAAAEWDRARPDGADARPDGAHARPDGAHASGDHPKRYDEIGPGRDGRPRGERLADGGLADGGHVKEAPLAEEAPFAADELRAFIEMTPHLRPNPRHIKRLINAYRLVRTLAQRAGEQTILSHRATVIHWLAISAQWPYTAHLMTRRFERDYLARGTFDGSSPMGLLGALYENTEASIDRDAQARMDDELDKLKELFTKVKIDIAAEDFHIIQRYTINFNPAVAELPIAAEEYREARPDKTAARGTK